MDNLSGAESEIRFFPDPDRVKRYQATDQPTEEHYCRVCGRVTVHVMSSKIYMDIRDQDWPYYICQFCGTEVPENPMFHCCRTCDPKMYANLDKGIAPQVALGLMSQEEWDRLAQKGPQQQT